MDELTHTVTITVTGNYTPEDYHEHASIRLAGDGSPEHMLDAFRAALYAAGHVEIAARLRMPRGF